MATSQFCNCKASLLNELLPLHDVSVKGRVEFRVRVLFLLGSSEQVHSDAVLKCQLVQK